MKVLIVDDDPKLQAYVSTGLVESGMECSTVGSAEEAALALANNPPFDIILLDVMMSGRSGWEFLEELREKGDATPTIFISARGSVEERVKGLQLGADDYIVKPFAFEELLARIDAVIRRRETLPVLRVEGLEVDPVHRRVQLDGTLIELSPREYALLLAFMEEKGNVMTRAQLLSKVWSIDFDPETNVVDVHVARLRRKLGKEHKDMIQTVKGEGYKFG